MNATIHTACSRHRSNGSTYYRAVAIVTDKGCKGYNMHRTAIEDKADDAMNAAIEYINREYRRDSMPIPATVKKYGTVPAIDIVTVTYYKRDDE